MPLDNDADLYKDYENKLDEKMKKQSKELDAREKRYRGLVSRVFSTDDGKQLLKAWEQSYLYAPSYKPAAGKEHIFIREGENKFIRKILIDLNIHKNTIEGV
jgi:hypothetical protein